MPLEYGRSLQGGGSRMKRKAVKPFRRLDDDLKVILQTGTKQATLRKKETSKGEE